MENHSSETDIKRLEEIKFLEALMEEMANMPHVPHERQPGELNTYEKLNRERAG